MRNVMIKVSVIVPVYNAEKYLNECLESLCRQTLSEIEIICINDHSNDKSLEILNRAKLADNRIIIIQNENNIGAAESRNRGIDFANGEYIHFVDADDYLEYDALEKLYHLSKHKNADMCFLGMKLINNDCKDKTPSGIKGNYPNVYQGLDLLRSFVRGNEFFLYLCLVFYRTTFVKQNHIYFNPLVVGEGGDFILRALCLANNAIVCPHKFYYYRINPDSITHKSDAKSNLLAGQIVQYGNVLRYFSQHDTADALEDFLLWQYKKIAGGIQNLSNNEKEEISNKLSSNYHKYLFEMFFRSNNIYGIEFDENTVKRIKSKGTVIIYGAGYASHEVIIQLQRKQIEIKGFAVTKRNNGQNNLYGHHIYEIQELQQYSDKSIVIVAANKIHKEDIRYTLDIYGFQDYIFLDVEI